MSAKKIYTIEIQGVKQSIDSVEALSKQLYNLEQRIDKLYQKGVSVGGSLGGKRTSELTEEQKIIDQINRSQEKRAALEGEVGKLLMQEKQAMKEVNAESKALAASDRLANGGYSNTMLGLKQELADIKATLQTTDLGSDSFTQMTQRANELTEKLKEIEESYGTFSRNVGNYSNSIQDSFKQITITIGDQEVTFNSTKEALRTLRENIKGMTVEGKENTEEYKQQSQALHDLEMAMQRADSAVQDLQKSSTGMDAALDWMESFGALGQISQGFSSMFGGTGLEETIQKLMSLQSVLQGVEKIRKQMNTGEGIGGMFSKAGKSIDNFAAKLMGVKGGMEGLATATKGTTVAVKGLSMALKVTGIGLLMAAIPTVIGLVEKWTKGNERLADSNDIVSDSISFENKKLDEYKEKLREDYYKGQIDANELYQKEVEATIDTIEKELKEFDKFKKLTDALDENQSGYLINGIIPNEEYKNLDELTERWKTLRDAMLRDGGTLEGLMTLKHTKYGLVALGEFEKSYKHAMETMKRDTKEGEKELEELVKMMNSNELLNSLFANPDKYINSEAFKQRVQEMKNSLLSFYSMVKSSNQLQLDQLGIDAMQDGFAKRKAQIDLNYKKEKEQWKNHLQDRISDEEGAMTVEEALEKKHQNQLNALQTSGAKRTISTAKSTAKQTLDVEREKKRLEIELMSDGLKKRLAQLNKQRDEELQKVRGHKELELKVNQLYDKRILEERKKYADETKKIYEDLYRNILDMTIDNLQGQLDYMDNTLEEKLNNMYDRRGIQSFSQPFSINQMFGNLNGEQEKYIEKLTKLLREDMTLVRQIQKLAGNGLNAPELDNRKNEVEKELYALKKEYNDLFKEGDFDNIRELVQNFDVTFNVSLEQFKLYLIRTNRFWKEEYIKAIEKNINDEYETRKKLLDKNREKEEEDNKRWRKEQIDKLNEWAKQENENDKISIEKRAENVKIYNDRLLDIITQSNEKQKQIEQKYNAEQIKIDEEKNKKINEQTKEANNKRLNDNISAIQQFSQIVKANVDRQPIRNAFGFIEVGNTNKILQESLDALILLRDKIIETRRDLRKMWDEGQITTDEYNDKLSDLENQMEGLDEQINKTKEDLSWEGKLQDFFQTFSQYFSEVTSAVQQVWGELDNLANYNLDRQQDALDKENEMLQDKLDEQEEILERHKERVDSIEGQLADARGDRRERLIDALNEEIIAQRRAQSEKERLEKEQAKLEEKQKELDFQRELNQYYSGLRGILFNTAQAVMAAATNSWPLPAIPLMALAAAAGGAQYAIASQQRPIKRAEGGLLMGASHANGGIPVGGTGIEVEGNEFVVRKSSTMENLELLEYINSSQRKLDLSDMLEFFRNGGKTIINNTSKTRFADGGMLDISDYPNFNIGSAFEAYSNRPVVVSVQDINARQAQVRQVQVLANVN